MIVAVAVFAAALVIAGAMIGILAVLAVGNRRQDNSGRLDESHGKAELGTRAMTGLHTLRYVVQPPGYRDDLLVPSRDRGLPEMSKLRRRSPKTFRLSGLPGASPDNQVVRGVAER